MSRKYKFHDQDKLYFISFATVHWIDVFVREEYNPIEIKDQEMFDKTLDYIHQNPVVAGFVFKPEDWKYSSARDFCGMKGLVELSYS